MRIVFIYDILYVNTGFVLDWNVKEELIMATPHNAANMGDIAETILLPGDPLRAKVIAETFLENPVQFNTVRNMFGYTGTYKVKKVSVM